MTTTRTMTQGDKKSKNTNVTKTSNKTNTFINKYIIEIKGNNGDYDKIECGNINTILKYLESNKITDGKFSLKDNVLKFTN